MFDWKKFSRAFFFSLLALTLLAGLIAPRVDEAQAAPREASATGIVISEFRTRGPSGADDEFIELYNPTNSSVDITGWKIFRSNNSGAELEHFTFGSVTLLSGQYYLIARSGTGNYTGSTAADATYSTSIADAGGIALFNGTTLVDAVGTHNSSAYKEGTILSPLSGNLDQSYGRKDGGCLDDNNNSSDFQLINPSTPKNHSSQRELCGIASDLSLAQSVDNLAPIIGDPVQYTITLTNNGPTDATGINVSINLPAGLTYVSDDGGVGSGTGTWSIPSLTNGSSATLLVNTTVGVATVITNTVSITSSDQFDPDTTNNSASVQVFPPGSTALVITNTVNNPTPAVGSNIIFTVRVTNPSAYPFAATGVVVSGLGLPFSGLTYISDDSAGTYSPISGMWTIGSLALGETKTLKITVKVTTSGAKTLTANVTSDQYIPASDSATVTPLGGTESDLRIEHLPPSRSTTTAGVAVLKIKVHNDGPDTATGVQVKDVLPTGLTYVSHSGGTYTPSTGIWTVGSLANGADTTLTINVKVRANGSSTKNIAEIFSSNQYDSNLTNNQAEMEVSTADLSLTESVEITGTTSSGAAIFTITVKNNGPDDATGVKVKTSLHLAPASSVYTFVSYGSVPASTYTSGTGVWDIGTLADGATATLTITTTTSGLLVANWAEISASDMTDPDSLPGNNSRNEDDDDGKPAADLSLTMSVNTSRPDLGTNVIFTLTLRNSGPEDTTGVTVKDILPDGLTYVTHSGGTYNKTTGIWNIGRINKNSTKILYITAKAATGGAKTNHAEVWKSNLSDPDSAPANNAATEDDYAGASVIPISRVKSVIISEVAWAGTESSSSDEWIELYNPGSTPVNISGWWLTISDSFSTTTSSKVYLKNVSIPAESYYILAASDGVFLGNDITIDQVAYLGLSNSGERLYLVDSSGSVIDTANNDGGAWPAGSSSTYATMERNQKYSTYTYVDTLWEWTTYASTRIWARDRGDEPILGTPGRTNWAFDVTITPTAQRTPTRVRTATPSLEGRLIINEILARPGYDWNRDGRVDVFDEFIELKNIGNDKINLKGWRLDDVANGGSDAFNLPSVVLQPGQRLLFFGLETKILLGDGGDTVRLIGPNNKEYDNYEYIVIKDEDKSICRLPDGNGAWYMDCIPTPNLINTRDGTVPIMPDNAYVSPVCSLPDTLPADFLFAECRGYGAGIWRMYWEADSLIIYNSKQGTIIE